MQSRYAADINNAFYNGLFSHDLLAWMQKNDPAVYMQAISKKNKPVWIPCCQFARYFGNEVGKQSKLQAIIAAIPTDINHVTLDRQETDKTENASLYWISSVFHLKKVLKAFKDVKHIHSMSLAQNKLFLLRQYRRHPEYIGVDLFEVLMTDIPVSVRQLDLSRNDPDSDFTTSQRLEWQAEKRNLAPVSTRTRNQDVDLDAMALAFKEESIGEYKKKLLQIPDHIESLDLSYNYLYKFGADALLDILSVLDQKKELSYLNISGNLIETLGEKFKATLAVKLPNVYIDDWSVNVNSMSDSQKSLEEKSEISVVPSKSHSAYAQARLFAPSMSGEGVILHSEQKPAYKKQ